MVLYVCSVLTVFSDRVHVLRIVHLRGDDSVLKLVCKLASSHAYSNTY
jgi:hypothetical protein